MKNNVPATSLSSFDHNGINSAILILKNLRQELQFIMKVKLNLLVTDDNIVLTAH
jgi:hypothetical protein